MAICINCKYYWRSKDCDGKTITGCAQCGDISNPTEDIYCSEVDGFEGNIDAWERSKRSTEATKKGIL